MVIGNFKFWQNMVKVKKKDKTILSLSLYFAFVFVFIYVGKSVLFIFKNKL